PALGVDADRGAQVDERLLESLRAHVAPPVDIAGVPFLQRLLDPRVAGEVDVVRYQAVIVDIDDVHGHFLASDSRSLPRLRWRVGRGPLPTGPPPVGLPRQPGRGKPPIPSPPQLGVTPPP